MHMILALLPQQTDAFRYRTSMVARKDCCSAHISFFVEVLPVVSLCLEFGLVQLVLAVSSLVLAVHWRYKTIRLL